MRNAKTSDVIVVSYDSGGAFHCAAIYASDRIHALVGLEKRVTLVTSPASDLISTRNVKVIKVPSVSLKDFRFEFTTAVSNSQASLLLALFWPVALLFGSIFDLSFKVLAGAESDGRYSWSLLATPVLIALKITNPIAVVYATGGASSGPVSGVLASVFSKRKPVVEFQDPFIGQMMKLSPLASKVMLTLERFIVRHSAKVINITVRATTDMKERNQLLSHRIQHIYPGSRAFEVTNSIPDKSRFKPKFIQILHMGTLYGSRNLNLFFEALDALYVRRVDLRGAVLISNMGGVNLPELQGYLLRQDFEHLQQLPRQDAVRRAALSDILLLVQHTDNRSAETIPYKTYDYLNLDKPVLALGTSVELRQMIEHSGGFFAENSGADVVEKSLEKAIDMILSGGDIAPSKPKILLNEQISLALDFE